MKSALKLEKLSCVLAASGSEEVSLEGDVLVYRFPADSLEQVAAAIERAYYVLPPALSIGFPEPIFVDQVSGTVDGKKFGWELNPCPVQIPWTSREALQNGLRFAWRHLNVAAEQERLFAALHYLHVARRLHSAAVVRGEFTAAAILYLCKSLETLFPGSEGKTRRAVRKGLEDLGIPKLDIEAKYMPAVVLRSTLDVAHVGWALLSTEQLTLLNAYAEQAISSFSDLFETILERLSQQKMKFKTLKYEKPSREVELFFETLRDNLQKQEQTGASKDREGEICIRQDGSDRRKADWKAHKRGMCHRDGAGRQRGGVTKSECRVACSIASWITAASAFSPARRGSRNPGK